MKKEINLRIAGEAGQGVETLGLEFCKIAKKAGFHFFAHFDYMSRIRGGNNIVMIRIAEHPVYSFRDSCDILVALDKKSAGIHRAAIKKNGLCIHDAGSDDNEIKNDLRMPMKQIAQEKGGAPLYANTVALGALSSILGFPLDGVQAVLRETFAAKGREILDKNIAAATEGFHFAAQHAPRTFQGMKPQRLADALFMNGNEAIALGALASGLRFYSAYPMTPSTSIMNTIAQYAKKFNVVVEQAEDEIAAINMAIGASFAGVRAMTGTSGGGFALMCEGLSLAGMTETPVVIAVAQRPGPATGLPTRTEQGDLNFILHAGHGEFARIVYTPGTVKEAFYCTMNAFNAAEKYQIPVIIMTDQYLADCLLDTPSFRLDAVKPVRMIIPREEGDSVKEYRRYALTGNGLSPRAVPSWIDSVVSVDSDEHTEEGHITESASVRKKMVEKRFLKRIKLLEKSALPPVLYGKKEAKKKFVCFGSNHNVLKETVQSMDAKKICIVHLPQVWPLPKKKLGGIFETAREIYTVENNAGGQLAGLLRRELGVTVSDSILKYDGRPFSLDEMIREITKRC